jgi:hypothetical protein
MDRPRLLRCENILCRRASAAKQQQRSRCVVNQFVEITCDDVSPPPFDIPSMMTSVLFFGKTEKGKKKRGIQRSRIKRRNQAKAVLFVVFSSIDIEAFSFLHSKKKSKRRE